MKTNYQLFVEKYGPDELSHDEPTEGEKGPLHELWEENMRMREFAASLLSRVTFCPICYSEYIGRNNYGCDPFVTCINGHSANEQHGAAMFDNRPDSKCLLCEHYEADSGDHSVGMAGYELCLHNMNNIKGWPFIDGCVRFSYTGDPTRLESWLDNQAKQKAEWERWSPQRKAHQKKMTEKYARMRH